MSATLFANELSHLSSEAKRKNADLRSAADKALQELKSLPSTSETQLAADLSRRPTFIEPFLIACNTKNAKFAGSGIVCLQRLVISKGLPKVRLQETLGAFNACTDLGLDIQLKILQALPSLLQNYASELEGNLLSSALQVCSSLQTAKASTVSGVAAATLQSLITSVFEKVETEDSNAERTAPTAEIPGDDGTLQLRPAAYDAYRVFRDLALSADSRSTKFVEFTSFSADNGLELIWSCIDSNPELFGAHEELMAVVRSNVLPLVVRALSERLPFSTTVRSLRLLGMILDRHLSRFSEDCEVALNLCTQLLEPEIAPIWKRSLVMELLRDFFSNSNHVIEAYSMFDGREGGKPIVQDMMSAFVRLSTEKPSAIGLGQQSTVPTGPAVQRDTIPEETTFEAAGMAGVISSALGVAEASVAGISNQWSLPKIPCMEQLDKNDPPPVPETYIYALVLECLNGLSDALARTVLPLTVQHERSRTKSSSGSSEANGGSRGRSTSFRSRAVPMNPLDAKDAPYAGKVRAVAGLVDKCWPAVLATASTFLNAALDDQYFRNLIKAYQRFAQVAGLLRLTTPRDALMTTLAKAAVPPQVLSAATSETMKSPATDSPRVLSSPRGLLSVDSFVSQASSLSTDTSRRQSIDHARPILTVRNLLCLRALLNLAIALGPILGRAFSVIVTALKQADMVLSRTNPKQMTRQASYAGHRASDDPSIVQAFSSEVGAVEAAASRLLESTADYPDDAFLIVLQTFCQLLHARPEQVQSPSVSPRPETTPPTTPLTARRTFSGLPGLSSFVELQLRDYQFVIPKLGTLAELNICRFIASNDADGTGWNMLINELTSTAKSNTSPREARRSAANVMAKLAEAAIAEVAKEDRDDRASVQRRALASLLHLVDEIYLEQSDLSNVDLEVQSQVMECLRTILERGGETLVAGWNRIVAILSVAFEHSGSPNRGPDDDIARIDWTQVTTSLVSPPIGRVAFAATQLVCSDFLSSVPGGVVPSLVELLYRFMCQKDDLNAALTTVTMAWNVSDAVFSQFFGTDLDSLVEQIEDEDLEDALANLQDLPAAQWLFMLTRLRDAAGSTSREVRNAAFQTLCNVFKNHGDEIPPTCWKALLRSTLFQLSRVDAMLYSEESDSEQTSDAELSRSILDGTSGVLAAHIRVIEQIPQLPSLWESFLSMLERYLDLDIHLLTAGAWSALSRVLAAAGGPKWKDLTYRTLALWLKRVPATGPTSENACQSNQAAFTAYTEAGQEIATLTGDKISDAQGRNMLENLFEIIKQSDGPCYDRESLSPLQTKALTLLRGLPASRSALVVVASRLSTLHHDSVPSSGVITGPTYLAIAHESVTWLQILISGGDIESDDALPQAIQSLRRIIETKYGYRLEHKGMPLWHVATQTAVALAPVVLGDLQDASEELWSEYARIASSIVMGKDMHLVEDRLKIQNDMDFDIEQYKILREVITAHLGSAELPDQLRFDYTRALFDASIVHPTEKGEVPPPGQPPLEGIGKVRRGRVKKVPYSYREDMSYVCFKELIALSSNATEGGAKLAKAAAPLLVLRLAIPIRAYIADQPLRGLNPQPLSELEELVFCFDSIRDLKLAPGALGSDSSERAHMRYLSPLLIKAVATAGDSWSGTQEVLRPLQETLAALSQDSLGDL
ncbi:hypothetical protein DOTSEDRAFT_69034 [Dothistroma septosporum NZE10]|uniref:Endosomal peripheral membrane protein n=1 Tax=Dothistroma septosporum (strain NZE10 / CBS 128990) TaxID=675120 RepID=N1Q3K4_DOTSN|nr:hypothetical protein DOTSEDRAFT_69034 [Dothistroma septosporum NZE10]